MKFILGTKQNMTQFFDADGNAYAATVVKAGPLSVIQVKTKEKDGYSAVQVGFGAKRDKLVAKAQKGHFKDLGMFRFVREFRLSPEAVAGFTVGQTLNADVFQAGDVIAVSGTSKGKGFQGVVKRHGFSGGRRTHGQKHSEREPGSIGGGGRAGGRVVKGMRMAGRMGGDRITVKNLSVLDVSPEESLLMIRGAVPGKPGSLLEIVSK